MAVMKTALILCVIFTTGYTNDILQVTSKINSNAVIRQLFEMMKYFLRNGHIEKNIPVLDPFQFHYKVIEIFLPSTLLSLHGDFKNGTLKGLAYFQVEEVEFIKKDIAVDMLINFPLIHFKSESYNVKGDIYHAIPLEGDGKFDMGIHKFLFKCRVYLKQSSNQKSILIHNVTSLQFNIGQIISDSFFHTRLTYVVKEMVTYYYNKAMVVYYRTKSRTNYDRNIDDIINSMINDLLASYINRFNHFISHKCLSDIIKLVNIFLNKLDSWSILTAIL